MNLHFTEHAESRLRKRKLERAWVERIVANPSRSEPDPTDPALEHRFGAVPELANRVLKVIVTQEEPTRVITMHLVRKLKGQL
ncbi:MAG: DUF4258 domain-containing protein [Bdellovibrionaceae bacterium]|nr:DUF4258 domain-containing protein [Pseudobdellovibrionaceae bacterium]